MEDGIGNHVGHDATNRRAVGDVGLDVDHRDVIAVILEVRGQPLTHEALATR